MKIAIDISQIAYVGTGVARYTQMLVESILEFDTTNEYTFFFSSLRSKLPADIEQKILQKHRLTKRKLPPTLLNIMWNRFHIVSINQLIKTHDVFISSDWTQPPVQKPMKSVTVVHDLVYLKYPDTVHSTILATQKKRMHWVQKDVDMIIADSHSTKQDLIDLVGIDKDKINVVYPAVTVLQPTDDDLKRIYSTYSIRNTKYVLAVGKLEPRKNIARLISAFQKAHLDDTTLLIVGPKGWDNTQSSTLHPPSSNIRFLGFVPDADLFALYKNALFFIYPSLYEGFGFPLVEAMSLGCPVATSNTSSMKEIAEGYGLLFDPESEEDIIEAIETLYANEKLRKELSEKGKKRAKDFTKMQFNNDFLTSLTKL